MGRIKTRILKSKTRDMMDKYGDQVTDEFDKNKAVVDSSAEVSSKKLRNIMAGYATRLKKLGKY